MKSVGDSELVINGRRIPTSLQQFTIAGDDFDVETIVHYSADTPPYHLRRETTATQKADARTTTTVVEIVALDLPQKVLGEVKSVAAVKTVKKHAKGSSVTVEMHCDEVPGGVVSHAAAEYDAEGNVARRSTLQTVDFSIGEGQIEDTASAVRRRKSHRVRRRTE